MKDRDIVAELIADELGELMDPHDFADILLGLGLRPPARKITTPAELDTLQPAADILAHRERYGTSPAAAVIRDDAGWVLERDVEAGNVRDEDGAAHWWVMGFDRDDVMSDSPDSITYPVTVLFAPIEDASR